MAVARRTGPLRLAVLISGRGSNLLAIDDACRAGLLDAQVVLVLSDQPTAFGLQAARERGLDAQAVAPGDHRGADGRPDRAAFEAALAERIEAAAAEFVVLAGFMRVLSPTFVARFRDRILNIHPSLLPSYKGLHTHERILAAGEPVHGASVHFVDATLDGGPVVLQARVPVEAGDTPATLSARVQRREHILYPRVIQWIAQGRLTCFDGQPRLDGVPLREPRLLD